jgi:predicted permease
MAEVILQTLVPIYLLIALGYIARRFDFLQAGDERVLSSFVYYFSLPALFFLNISALRWDLQLFSFVVWSVIPVAILVLLLLFLRLVFSFSRDLFFLLILTSCFGSAAFFGIPFILFTFPGAQGEKLGTLAGASIGIVTILISLSALELYHHQNSKLWPTLKMLLVKFSKNPLIWAILLGVVCSILHFPIPKPLMGAVSMLGKATAAVAIFMLGVFFYGRRYGQWAKAISLALIRMIIPSVLTFFLLRWSGLTSMEMAILVLMHGMPAAIALMVFSERYQFHQEIISTHILVTSLTAPLFLGVWMVFLL